MDFVRGKENELLTLTAMSCVAQKSVDVHVSS